MNWLLDPAPLTKKFLVMLNPFLLPHLNLSMGNAHGYV
jgi:hypothetical protein